MPCTSSPSSNSESCRCPFLLAPSQVDTAGWTERSGKEKGPASLSVVQSRKNLMRAHIVALVLDAEKIAKSKSSMNHPEVVIARQAIEEGRGLVVIVNKMDLLRGNQRLFEKVLDAVPREIQTVIPQVTGIPVVFVSALEGRGRIAVMHQVIDTYENWCLRLSTSRLNRWLRKVMSRHSWKDSATQPKVKYFTQVKARPPAFVAFMSGKTNLSDTDIRFLTKSLKARSKRSNLIAAENLDEEFPRHGRRHHDSCVFPGIPKNFAHPSSTYKLHTSIYLLHKLIAWILVWVKQTKLNSLPITKQLSRRAFPAPEFLIH